MHSHIDKNVLIREELLCNLQTFIILFSVNISSCKLIILQLYIFAVNINVWIANVHRKYIIIEVQPYDKDVTPTSIEVLKKKWFLGSTTVSNYKVYCQFYPWLPTYYLFTILLILDTIFYLQAAYDINESVNSTHDNFVT